MPSSSSNTERYGARSVTMSSRSGAGRQETMQQSSFSCGELPTICAGCRERQKGKALTTVEELIYSHAVGIDSESAALRQWSELQSHRDRLAELRSALRQEVEREVRKDLRRDIRRELTAKLRLVKGRQLDRLVDNSERGKETLEMQLPGRTLRR